MEFGTVVIVVAIVAVVVAALSYRGAGGIYSQPYSWAAGATARNASAQSGATRRAGCGR